jgi:hypothetical protein
VAVSSDSERLTKELAQPALSARYPLELTFNESARELFIEWLWPKQKIDL